MQYVNWDYIRVQTRVVIDKIAKMTPYTTMIDLPYI